MHLFTVDQASALLPDVERLLAEARTELAAAQDAAANLEDLFIIWGQAVGDPSCEAHPEWLEYRNRLAASKQQVDDRLHRLEQMGVQVKDVAEGLVDFPARRGDDIVLLCYRAGEGRLQAWHTLQGGFAGRQPLENL